MSTRKRRSTIEWQALIELEQKNHLNTHDFCQEHELNYKYYSKKKNELKLRHPTESQKNGFIKLESHRVPQQASQPIIEIIYRDTRLQLSTDIEPYWVSQLLKELS